MFKGVLLEDLIPLIDAPRLELLSPEFFYKPFFDIPRL
jgi:hypothetical protein